MFSPHFERINAEPGRDQVDVLFYLQTGDDWPPYPGETVAARLISPFVVEVVAAPRYACGINRGDQIAVIHDGFGYIGRHVKNFGGHSTVRVVATSAAELQPIAEVLTENGAHVESFDDPTMLVVDVPADADLGHIRTVLEAAVSMTCNYEVASDRHSANGATR